MTVQNGGERAMLVPESEKTTSDPTSRRRRPYRSAKAPRNGEHDAREEIRGDEEACLCVREQKLVAEGGQCGAEQWDAEWRHRGAEQHHPDGGRVPRDAFAHFHATLRLFGAVGGKDGYRLVTSYPDGIPERVRGAAVVEREGMTLLCADTVVCDAESVVEGGAVVVEGDRIAAVGDREDLRERYPDHERVESDLLAPGLVGGHVHSVQSLGRGIADDEELLDWLFDHVLPMEASMGPEEMRAAADLAYLELVESGTTTAIDHLSVSHADQAFEAAGTAACARSWGRS